MVASRDIYVLVCVSKDLLWYCVVMNKEYIKKILLVGP
jgi:hypothetical protein